VANIAADEQIPVAGQLMARLHGRRGGGTAATGAYGTSSHTLALFLKEEFSPLSKHDSISV
jgi:hypothetical protein